MVESSPNLLFSASEQARYGRHFLLPQVGLVGQVKLKNARVLCVGAGALGSVVLPLLTSAGIGHISIVDDDTIELSNLQRQTLYTTAEIDELKVDVAKRRLQNLNPEISIVAHALRMSIDNCDSLVQGHDYLVDCTDNLSSRYLFSTMCHRYNIPYVFGGIYQFIGQCGVLCMPGHACYHCLYPNCPPEGAMPNCAEAGVLSSLPGIIGSFQASELFKLILGIGSTLASRLFVIDVLKMIPQCLEVSKRVGCINCDNTDLLTLEKLVKYPKPCQVESAYNIAALQAKMKMEQLGSKCALLDVRESYEREKGHIGGYHFPLSELEKNLEKIINLQKIFIVYCASGVRSLKAVNLLRKNDVDCYNLIDGIGSW